MITQQEPRATLAEFLRYHNFSSVVDLEDHQTALYEMLLGFMESEYADNNDRRIAVAFMHFQFKGFFNDLSAIAEKKIVLDDKRILKIIKNNYFEEKEVEANLFILDEFFTGFQESDRADSEQARMHSHRLYFAFRELFSILKTIKY